ncbi:hypothetical protein WA158_008159 [Blastocystis sp. Blastoise]
MIRDGYTDEQIAIHFHCSLRTVARRRSQYNMSKSTKKGGRPQVLTPSNLREINNIVPKSSENSSVLLDIFQKKTGTHVSKRSFIRGLHAVGYVAKKKLHKPLISEKNRKVRLDWCLKYRNMPISFWENVLWSDECSIRTHQSTFQEYYWKKPGSPNKPSEIIPTMKNDGKSIMIWGCMTQHGAGQMEVLDGHVTSLKYGETLGRTLPSTVEKLQIDPKTMVFQQDNAPIHKSKKMNSFFKTAQLTVIDWPPQSPDLNPIEHLWVYIKRRLQRNSHCGYTLSQLKVEVDKIWRSIPVNVCERLVLSMPKRIEAVIANNGGFTRY